MPTSCRQSQQQHFDQVAWMGESFGGLRPAESLIGRMNDLTPNCGHLDSLGDAGNDLEDAKTWVITTAN